jgi:hypothetical protein
MYARIGGTDVYDSPVAAETASNIYICSFQPVSLYGVEHNDIPCKGVPSVVYIVASNPDQTRLGNT